MIVDSKHASKLMVQQFLNNVRSYAQSAQFCTKGAAKDVRG